MVNTDNSSRYSNIVSVKNELTGELDIFPNPSAGKIDIWFVSEKISPVVISIYDMNGKLVFNNRLLASRGSNTATANISALAPGNYTLKIEMGTKVITKKISKF